MKKKSLIANCTMKLSDTEQAKNPILSLDKTGSLVNERRKCQRTFPGILLKKQMQLTFCHIAQQRKLTLSKFNFNTISKFE